jgi:hypothetical protein
LLQDVSCLLVVSIRPAKTGGTLDHRGIFEIGDLDTPLKERSGLLDHRGIFEIGDLDPPLKERSGLLDHRRLL